MDVLELVPDGEIAGVKEAVVDGGGGLVGLLVVAGEDDVAADVWRLAVLPSAEEATPAQPRLFSRGVHVTPKFVEV